MAAEAVGGAFLSSFLAVLFDRVASHRIVHFFRCRKLDHRLLQKLKTCMNSVQSVLDDAEEEEISKLPLKQWLDDLKDALFEADDLLDEIRYEAMRLEVEAESVSAMDKVRKFLKPSNSFENGLEARLIDILETLVHLVNQKDVLGLRESTRAEQSIRRIPTTSLVERSSTFGREGDKEAIMRLFMLDDGNGSKNLSVISIMGMGGIGKTTPAQLIYRDDRVQERFDVKGWVCVSEDFDVPRITRDILNEVAPIAWDDKTLNQLQSELEKKLTGKRFLFVLDDVWNERFTDWDILLRPLKCGSPGSKIIITTRNDGVASTVSSNSIFRLNMLSSLNSWQLFCIHAFEDHNSSDYPCLEEIGREIVKRCHGLPLAVKVMGGLLRSKKNVKDWVNVLRNSLWDFSEGDIFPVLRLSYHYLPSHIKWCFAYCSIFPKAYEFKKDELVLLWIGEGLVISPKGNKTVEEVGDEYFDELVSRSFFQPVNDAYSSKFVMHDLLNDLARVVAGESCFRFEGKDFCKTPKRTLYFSCVVVEQESSQQLLDILKSTHLLRTFLPVYTSRWQHGKIQQEVIRVLFLKQQRLRVLSLSQCEHVVELPSSIGQLKHLRYLDFSATPITSLPECLCSLYNLQTLKLNQCNKLAELPTNMGRLINMQYLDIEGTNLQEMPPNMGKLIKLQKLTDFFVGKREGCRVKELGNLQHLRGTLKIQNLQNVVNAQDSLEAKVNCKKYLKDLKLEWKGDTDDTHHEKVVLDRLQPHTEIEAISIIGYGGTSFPNWLGGSSFTKLFSLELKGCRYCSCLPPLGQILSLKYLTIIGFDAVMVINSDFYGRCLSSSMKPFQSLEILSLIDLPQLQEWIPYGTEEQTGAFPCLKQLYVTNCPTLTGSLPSQLPSLTTFEINACPQLQFCVPNSPNLSSMVFSDGSRKMNFHDSTSLNIIQFYCQDSALEEMGKLGLEQITIAKYKPLECFPLELFPKLRSLDIKECPHYESFCTPNQECLKFVPFEFLTELLLWDCPKLKFLPQCMHYLLPSLLDLRIYGCPEIETFPEDGLPSKLRSLTISDCNKLIARRMHWNLQKLTSLTSLQIWEYEAEEMECFPDLTLLPSSLTSLGISILPNLKSLNYKGLQHLNSLKELQICHCPKLQLVPEEGLPSTHASLRVTDIQILVSLVNRRFHDLTLLRELHIWDCPYIVSLPEEGLPPNLITLTLMELQNLSSVVGLRQLMFLEGLGIDNCPHLQSFPEGNLPSSHSSLHIWDCQLLERRCQREKGEDWSKISHIPFIEIDWDRI